MYSQSRKILSTFFSNVAWVSGVSGGKGKDGSEKRRELKYQAFLGERGKMEAKKGESWRSIYLRSVTSGSIVCYPITATSRFWMCHTICWMVLCQAFLSLLPLPPPPSKNLLSPSPSGRPDTQAISNAVCLSMFTCQLATLTIKSLL